MIELRVLQGFQAGARLRLAPGTYRVGGGDACDVILSGQGIGAEALHLIVEQDKVVVIPGDSGCGTEAAADLELPFEVAPGQPFRVGATWLAIADEAAPWPRQGQWPVAPEKGERQDAAVVDPVPEASPVQQVSAASTTRHGRSRLRHLRGLSVGGLVALMAGSAVAYVLRPEPETPPALEKTPRNMLDVVLPRQDPVPAKPARTLPPDDREAFGAEALRALRRQLEERNLAQYLTVEGDAAGVRIAGELDAEKSRRLEEVLVPFTRQYGERLSIAASIAPPGRSLPFRIEQIASGSLAYVVTDGGVRIFEGGSYGGYRLVAVKPHTIVFAGRKRVELEW